MANMNIGVSNMTNQSTVIENQSPAKEKSALVRNDWSLDEVRQIYEKPILELIFQAASTHRQFHDPLYVQKCTLLSIKTGACPEDCAYCPQSARYTTNVE